MRDRIPPLHWIATALVLVGPLGHASAQPAPATAELRWEAPPECIDGPSLARATSTRLRREVFGGPGGVALIVSGRVETAPGGSWRALLELTDSQGVSLGARRLRGASARCHDLDDELAIVLALLVDQHREVALFVPVDPPSSGDPGESRHSEPRMRPSESMSVEPAVRAGVALSVGDMPSVGVGPHVALAVALGPRISIEGSGTFWVPRTYPLSRGRVSLWAWDAGVSACVHLGQATPLSLGGCAGVRAGSFYAAGEGYAVDQDGSGARASGVVGLRALLRLGPADLVLDLGVGVPLLRNSLTIVSSGVATRVFEPEVTFFLPTLSIQTPWGP